MMTKSGTRTTPALVSAFLIAFTTTASLVSCDDLFNSLFDTAAPSSLKASDGKYANRIEVSWTAPSLSGGKWDGKSVDGYIVRWWGPETDSAEISASQTGFTIWVSADHRAIEYEIEVATLVDDREEGSSSDTGFALETYDLIWRDGGADYSFSGTDRWYVTMLQKGFRYDFTFQDSNTGWMEFYDHGTLNKVHDTRDTEPTGAKSSPSWVCDEDGAWHKFYVRVVPSEVAVAPDTTSFHARFGF